MPTDYRNRLGRRHALDPNDKKYPMRLLLDPLREQFFPRGLPIGTRHYRPGAVLDQGDTGTCVGHGWRGWLDGAPLMTKSGPNPFDLYRAFVLQDEWDDNDNEATASNDELQAGTSVRAGAKVLQEQGRIKNYLWAQNAEDVRAWHLAGFGTVVLGITWREGMFEPDRDSYLSNTGPIAGGHCVKTTGWSDDHNAVRIQNSWGRMWGESGRAWIRRDDLDALILEDGEACAAVEQKITPLS